MDQADNLKRLRQEWLRETRRELTQLASRMLELRDREQKLLQQLKESEAKAAEQEQEQKIEMEQMMSAARALTSAAHEVLAEFGHALDVRPLPLDYGACGRKICGQIAAARWELLWATEEGLPKDVECAGDRLALLARPAAVLLRDVSAVGQLIDAADAWRRMRSKKEG